MKMLFAITFSVLTHLHAENKMAEIDGYFAEYTVVVSDLKTEAFEVLNAKCNICHRKQNPFKIFSLKNMERHAPKIYKQVFIKKRMPKGNKIKLTKLEYEKLKNWLNTLNSH
ncbi:MAG: hypothetical protein JKY48_13835 [Flavobacteriales bacterium]|nr:hypothetical protein [Flavobacteriales bacterium]